jgi:hypothetical protein
MPALTVVGAWRRDLRLKRYTDAFEANEIREIAYDPWNATHIALRLQDEGAAIVEFRQGFRSMSAPTRELEKLIVSRKLAYGGNPVTRWMAANVAVAQDPAGNLKPAKDKSTRRPHHGHRSRHARPGGVPALVPDANPAVAKRAALLPTMRSAGPAPPAAVREAQLLPICTRARADQG